MRFFEKWDSEFYRFSPPLECYIIGTLAALGIALGASAAGGVASAAIGAHAAGQAADAQANAAVESAKITADQANKALGFQEGTYNAGQQTLNPWLSAGRTGLVNLENLMGLPVSGTFNPNPTQVNIPGVPGSTTPLTQAGPMLGGGFNPSATADQVRPGFGMRPEEFTNRGIRGVTGTATAPATNGMVPLSSLVNPQLGPSGSLLQPFGETFQAPTDVTQQNDPGYKFRLQQGMDALQNSAAARGNLLTGQTLKDVNDYAQNFASGEYGNVYARSLGEFQQKYNIFENNQANTYNRLASMAGLGQTTANQLNSAGQAASNNVGSILLGSAAQQGSALQNAAAARASGYVGGANAITGGVNSIAGASQLLPLYSMLNGGFLGGGLDEAPTAQSWMPDNPVMGQPYYPH